MKSDRISSLFLIIVAIVVCFGSIRIGIGTFRDPDSGFVPLLAALLLGISSLLTLFQALPKNKFANASLKIPYNLQKVIKAFIGLFIYVLSLHILGYIIGTFLLMLFYIKGLEGMKWKWSLMTAVIIVFCSYLIFNMLLGVKFPMGLIDLTGLTRWK